MPGNTDGSDEDRCGGVGDDEEKDGTNGRLDTMVFRRRKPVLGVNARAHGNIIYLLLL